jgi:hypothetical protein
VKVEGEKEKGYRHQMRCLVSFYFYFTFTVYLESRIGSKESFAQILTAWLGCTCHMPHATLFLVKEPGCLATLMYNVTYLES